jgi:hypothetical protein
MFLARFEMISIILGYKVTATVYLLLKMNFSATQKTALIMTD